MDCLESMFLHSDIDDLLNLAHSCKFLKKLVESVFLRKFRHTKMNIQNITISKNRRIFVKKKTILIMDLRSALQILRCFGHLITDLEFNFLPPYNINQTSYDVHNHRVVAYLSDYCVKSVTKIALIECSKGNLTNINKPFEKVEEVRIRNCDLKTNWLKTVFPKMRSLQFLHDKHGKTDLSCIGQHFPHLMQFEIGIFDEKAAGFCQFYTANALILNPQLKSFNGMLLSSTIFTPDFLQFTKTFHGLQELEHLAIGWEIDDFANYNNRPMHFSKVKKFEMNLRFLHRTDLPEIPFSFDQLEEFSISLKQINQEFFNFIKKNPKIRKLKITPSCPVDYNGVSDIKFAEALPLLTELDLQFYKFTMHEAIGFLRKFRFLEKMSFTSKDKRIKELRQRLGNQWSVSVRCGNFVELKRL